MPKHKKKTIPEPFCSICDLPFDDQGWFHNDFALEHCMNFKPAKIVVEVGSWLGLSTRFMAKILPEDGKLYAVDTWQGSAEHTGDVRLPHLYQLFLSNIKQAGFADKVIPIRMSSAEAAQALNVTVDLIYIDASHDEDNVYQDITLWFPHLASDGIMCGDDWHLDSVKRAVLQASLNLNCKVHHVKNFWWYVKER